MDREPIYPEHWAPLREAVPSYHAAWAAYCASDLYEVGEAYIQLGDLARHVVQRVAAGDRSELPALFAAFEALYADASPALEAVLRIGFLEDLILATAETDVDPMIFYWSLGPESHEAWDRAQVWLSPDDD